MTNRIMLEHDAAHRDAIASLDEWTRTYLAKEGCGHCERCEHVRLEHYPRDAYISVQCHHPAVLSDVESGEIESVLDHDPVHDCPKKKVKPGARQ